MPFNSQTQNRNESIQTWSFLNEKLFSSHFGIARSLVHLKFEAMVILTEIWTKREIILTRSVTENVREL